MASYLKIGPSGHVRVALGSARAPRSPARMRGFWAPGGRGEGFKKRIALDGLVLHQIVKGDVECPSDLLERPDRGILVGPRFQLGQSAVGDARLLS